MGQDPADVVPVYDWLDDENLPTVSATDLNTDDLTIAIATGPQNFVYVLSFGEGVQKRNPDGSIVDANFITGLDSPLDIDVDKDGFIYIADFQAGGSTFEDNGQIKIFDQNGNYLRSILTSYFRPLGVDVQGDKVYIAEYNDGKQGPESTPSSRIRIVNKASGNAIAVNNDDVEVPLRIAVDSKENIYVSHAGNDDPAVLIFNSVLNLQGKLSNIESPGSVVIDEFDYIHVIEYAGRIDFSQFINFADLSFGEIQDIAEDIDKGTDDNAFGIKVYSTDRSFEYFYKDKIDFPVDLALNSCNRMYVDNAEVFGGNIIFIGYVPNRIEFDLEIYERTPAFDITDPVITCPAAITVQADSGQNSKVVNYDSATATDLCGVTVEKTSGLDSGSNFPVGEHEIVFTATDSFGNTSECTLKITVNPGEPEDLTIIECNYDVLEFSVNENCEFILDDFRDDFTASDEDATILQDPPPGTLLSSEQTITLTPTLDGEEGEACTFTVRPIDDSKPIINNCITEDPQVNLREGETYPVPDYENEVNPTDNCDSNLTFNQNPVAGTNISETTTVTISATDDSGNTSEECSFQIVVTRETPPEAICKSFEVLLDLNGQAQISAAQVYDGNEDLELSINKSNFSCDDIGDNTIVLTVTDPETGLSDICNATIRIIDNSAPQITNCANSNFEVRIPEGESYTLPNFENQFTAIDNCDNDLDFTQDPQPGTLYSEAANLDVRVRFTDDSGKSQSCLFTINIVVVEEDELVLNCPEIYEIEPDGNCNFPVPDLSSIVNFSPEEATITQSIAQGTIITEDTEVTVTATFNNQQEECNLFLRLVNNDPPQVACPADKSVNVAAGEEYTIPDYRDELNVSGSCGDISILQTPSPNTTVSEDVQISFEISDSFGNTSTCSFNLQLVSEGDLIINCPASKTLEFDENCSFTLPDFTAEAEVSNGNGQEIVQTPAPGTLITGTETEVTLSISSNGESDSCTFTVFLVDTTVPEISCPADKSINIAAGEEFTILDYRDELSIDEDCGDITIIQTPSPNSTITDDTQIIFEVSDSFGNTSTCRFNLQLVSEGDLTINCPAPKTGEFDENCSFTLPDFTAEAEVSNGNGQEIVQTPAPGTLITGTATEVTLSITSDGVTESCSFPITLQDNTPPEIRLKDIAVNLNSNGNAAITFDDIDNGSFDNCDPDVTYTLSKTSFSCKEVGENLVQVIAEDSSGNTSTANTTVTVLAEEGICEEPPLEGSEYIFIYPNPNTGSFKVATPGDVKLERIEVFDHRGRFIAAKDYESTDVEYAMHLGPLQEAVYVLKIITDKNTVTKRFIFKY